MLLSEIKAILKRKEKEGTQKMFDPRRMRVGSVFIVRLYHIKLSLVGDSFLLFYAMGLLLV